MRLSPLVMLALLAGCAGGATDVEYTPQRSISADIDASHLRGSTGNYPGIGGRTESVDVIPWRLGDHPR